VKDVAWGRVLLRHKDGARLRAICEGHGWRVVEGSAQRRD
jgi:hypothetical protein